MRLWHFIDFNADFKTITTRGTGNYRRGDYHCYVGVGQLSHHRASWWVTLPRANSWIVVLKNIQKKARKKQVLSVFLIFEIKPKISKKLRKSHFSSGFFGL